MFPSAFAERGATLHRSRVEFEQQLLFATNTPDPRLTHDDAATAADQPSASTNRLNRRWLALYRGDRWSLERIAEFDGTTIAKVWCGIVLAMRHEPGIGRRRTERRSELQAG